MKRTVEVKYGITLHTKQMIKVNELTTEGKIWLSICRLLILIFSEN